MPEGNDKNQASSGSADISQLNSDKHSVSACTQTSKQQTRKGLGVTSYQFSLTTT